MSETRVKVRQKSAVLVAEAGTKHLVETCSQPVADWENFRKILDSMFSCNSGLKRQVEAYILSSWHLSQREEGVFRETTINNPSSYLVYCGQCSELTEREHIAGFCPKCGYLCQPCEKEHSWVLSVLQEKVYGDAQ